MNRFGLFFSFLILNLIAHSQDVQVSNIGLTQYNKKTLLNWTIESGSTCSGIIIYHSTDSIQFDEIGQFFGVCGSLSEPIKYNFTHTDPVLNVNNYYRLKFGAQYSPIYSIHLTYVEPNQILLTPNPCENILKLNINKDQNFVYKLNIFDNSGILVKTENELYVDTFLLDVSDLSHGVYTLILEDENNKMIQNKFVKK